MRRLDTDRGKRRTIVAVAVARELTGFCWAIANTSARYQRMKSRRGHAKATIATGHKILTAVYHVLNKGVAYHEVGEEFFYRRDTENTERYRRRLVHQLERLGHQVTLQPLTEAA